MESSLPDCIVPAAGLSRRMGQPKQLLELDGEPLVVRVVSRLSAAGLRCIVVTGAEAEAVERALAPLSGVETVYNPLFQRGMLSSILAGVARVRTPWFLVAPADMPQLPLDLPPRLLEAALHAEQAAGGKQPADDQQAVGGQQSTERPVAVFPVRGGRRGHPVLIRTDVAAMVSAEAPSMREALAGLPVCELAVDSPGIFTDLDTPEDYKRFSGSGRGGARPGAD